MARWWSVALLVGASGSLADGFPPESPASPEIQKVRRPWVAVGLQQYGRVLSIDKESITINPAVQLCNRLDVQAPPRRFLLSEVLKAGRYRADACNWCRYTTADLQVGDIINVDYDQLDDVETCTMFCISQRPGGRVPPARDPIPTQDLLHHERANAMQDLLERGIPLPERFQNKLPPPPPPPVAPAPVEPLRR